MNRNVNCNDDDVYTSPKKNRSPNRRLLSVKCADAILDWFVFPLLLFVQFSTSMYCQEKLGVLNLKWMPTMGVVTVFCLGSVGYRHIYRVHPNQSMVLLLLPEIFTNTVLATVMFVDDLRVAFYTLSALTAIILVASMVGYRQVVNNNQSRGLPKVGEYELLHQDENEDSDDEWIC